MPSAPQRASDWWVCACKFAVPRGIDRASGISFALALAWSKSHSSMQYFNGLMEYYRVRLVRNRPFSKHNLRTGAGSIPIGMAIYDALINERAVEECIRRLTVENWATFVPEEKVVNALRDAGVSVKNFDRQRFIR